MYDQDVTPELRGWIIEQIALGHRPDAVLKSMCDTGWEHSTALAALEETIAGYLDDFSLRQQAPLAGVAERTAPSIGANQCWVEGRSVQVLASLQVPPLMIFGQFMSSQECGALIDLARERWHQSYSVLEHARSASVGCGVALEPGLDPRCASLERRIAGLIEEPMARCQGLQVLCFPAGAQYKPQEFLDGPLRPSSDGAGGARISVFLAYLNTPDQGGSIFFPEIGLELNPIQGNALFFSHDRADAHSRGLHMGSPVFRGEQWVLLKSIDAPKRGKS